MTTKRVLVVGAVILVLIAVTLQLLPSGSPRYRSDSIVAATPFTNALLARSFEAQVVRTIPGVLRLEATPTFLLRTGTTRPASPNAIGIRIIAFGRTPEDAEHAANDAAAQLCRTVLTNYGVSGELVDKATIPRRYSFFHDSFQPAVGRMFKR